MDGQTYAYTIITSNMHTQSHAYTCLRRQGVTHDINSPYCAGLAKQAFEQLSFV